MLGQTVKITHSFYFATRTYYVVIILYNHFACPHPKSRDAFVFRRFFVFAIGFDAPLMFTLRVTCSSNCYIQEFHCMYVSLYREHRSVLYSNIHTYMYVTILFLLPKWKWRIKNLCYTTNDYTVIFYVRRELYRCPLARECAITGLLKYIILVKSIWEIGITLSVRDYRSSSRRSLIIT